MVGLQFRTLFRIEMVITDLLSCFLSFFIIYLTVKWFMTNFEFFFIYLFINFFFLKILSLSRLYSYKTEALSVLYKPD